MGFAAAGVGRPVPAGRSGAGGGPGDQQPARDGGLPRRGGRGAAAGDPVAGRALPARHRPVRRQAGARAVPRDHRQDARPDPGRVQPALGDALRARALGAPGPRRRRGRVSGLAADRRAGDQLGQRRSPWRARPRRQALQPGDPGAAGPAGGAALLGGAARNAGRRGHARPRPRPWACDPARRSVAGGGDGQASGLGTGTLGGGRAYLNIGTAAVSGVWGHGSPRPMPSGPSAAFPARATSSSSACAPALSSPTGACAGCSRSIRRPIPPSTGGSKPRPPRCHRVPTASCCCPTGPAPWRRSGTPTRGRRRRARTGHGRGALLARDARGRGAGLRHGLRRHRGRDRRAGDAPC